MDGQPLHWYARQNEPLPRPVEARPCEIHALELIDWREVHDYDLPRDELDPEAAEMQRALEKMIREGKTSIAEAKASLPQSTGTINAADPVDNDKTANPVTGIGEGKEGKAPVFEIKMTVGSGTYVRSIVHDIGLALGSAAFVVKLTRTRQGDFALDPAAAGDDSTADSAKKGCVEWSVFEKAIAELDKQEAGATDSSEEKEWEKEILAKCEQV